VLSCKVDSNVSWMPLLTLMTTHLNQALPGEKPELVSHSCNLAAEMGNKHSMNNTLYRFLLADQNF